MSVRRWWTGFAASSALNEAARQLSAVLRPEAGWRRYGIDHPNPTGIAAYPESLKPRRNGRRRNDDRGGQKLDIKEWRRARIDLAHRNLRWRHRWWNGTEPPDAR